MDRKRHVLIGAGGVSTAEDAYKKIRLGASLVQLLTALIYQGPGVVREITKGLAQLLARDGVKHVADVVGVGCGVVRSVKLRLPPWSGRISKVQVLAVRSTSSVGMPQVPLRTVSTRVPGLRPVRTSDTSMPLTQAAPASPRCRRRASSSPRACPCPHWRPAGARLRR
jgi:hypothetical protein